MIPISLGALLGIPANINLSAQDLAKPKSRSSDSPRTTSTISSKPQHWEVSPYYLRSVQLAINKLPHNFRSIALQQLLEKEEEELHCYSQLLSLSTFNFANY
jgi:hypothetical protein